MERAANAPGNSKEINICWRGQNNLQELAFAGNQPYLKNGAGVVGGGQNHRAPSSEQAGPSALDRAVQVHALCRPFVHQQLFLYEPRKLRLLFDRGKREKTRAVGTRQRDQAPDLDKNAPPKPKPKLLLIVDLLVELLVEILVVTLVKDTTTHATPRTS